MSSPKKHQDEPVAASATVKAGNYGLRQTDASIALNNEHVSVNAFMQSLHTDNYRENNKKTARGWRGRSGLSPRRRQPLFLWAKNQLKSGFTRPTPYRPVYRRQ